MSYNGGVVKVHFSISKTILLQLTTAAVEATVEHSVQLIYMLSD